MLSDPSLIISIVIIIFFAIGLHEYAHCKFADMAGDPTPRIYGRVTLNLTKHFEPLGTMMMIFSSLSGVGIGWGRPAPMDPAKMRDPRWDFFIAILAGPMSNVLQAVVWGIIAKLFIMGKLMSQVELSAARFDFSVGIFPTFFYLAVSLNIGLALFNLIPLGRLDGHWLVGLLMPEQMRLQWFLWNRKVGTTALIVVIIGGQLMSRVDPRFDLISYIMPLRYFAANLILGIPSHND